MGDVFREVNAMQLTTEQLAAWKRDGIIVVPNVFSPDTIAPALEEMEHNAYEW